MRFLNSVNTGASTWLPPGPTAQNPEDVALVVHGDAGDDVVGLVAADLPLRIRTWIASMKTTDFTGAAPAIAGQGSGEHETLLTDADRSPKIGVA
jgi:hypothetical protein